MWLDATCRSFAGNQLTGTVPSELGALTRIEQWCVGTYVISDIYTWLQQLESVEEQVFLVNVSTQAYEIQEDSLGLDVDMDKDMDHRFLAILDEIHLL